MGTPDDEQRQKLKNLMIFKMYVTDQERDQILSSKWFYILFGIMALLILAIVFYFRPH